LGPGLERDRGVRAVAYAMIPCPDRRQGIIIVPLIEIRMVGRIAMTFEEIEGGAKANLRRVSILFFGPAAEGAAQARMMQWR
jgi:hypothetical protein